MLTRSKIRELYKGAKIQFNKHVATTALHTNFLEVKMLVIKGLIEKYPLVGPMLHPNYSLKESKKMSITEYQVHYKTYYRKQFKSI